MKISKRWRAVPAAALIPSNDLIAFSVVQDAGSGDWLRVQSIIAILDTAALTFEGIDAATTASVVG